MNQFLGSALTHVDQWSARFGINRLLADPMQIRLLTIVLIFIILVLAYWIASRVLFGRGGRGDSIVLVGPINAGKTRLFYELFDGSYRSTVSSMAVNTARFVPTQLITGKRVAYRYVDFPGHLSLRPRFKEYLPSARALIFMVDGADDEQIPNVARDLFSLLTNDQVAARSRVPILVAVNKSDLSASKTAEQIAAALLPLIDKQRDAAIVPDLQMDGSAVKTLQLGKQNQPFRWEQSPVPVRFASISVQSKKLDPLLQFIQTL